jgi:hypothetical protein
MHRVPGEPAVGNMNGRHPKDGGEARLVRRYRVREHARGDVGVHVEQLTRRRGSEAREDRHVPAGPVR